MGDGVNRELLEFIVLHVDSVELLEVLSLLYSQPDKEWSVGDINIVIRSSLQSIEGRLEHLISLGFISGNKESKKFQYQPASQELKLLGDNIILTYQTRRVEVIGLIYTKPMKEIVNFSNAFKIRGGQKKDE